MEKEQIQKYLASDFTYPIRDPLWHHIYLSRPIKNICLTPAFMKLHNILQLGPTYLLYPGATHTRAAHSYGVYEVTKRIICELLKHQDCPPLTLAGVKGLLVAALLHDTGHFPYAHSLKELPLKEHEAITATLILEDPIKSIIENELEADPYFCAAIVDSKMDLQSIAPHLVGNKELSLYQNILSGTLDPDKLDYLNRDAFFCGVPYGIQDIDFILNKIQPCGYEGISVAESAIPSIENLLFSKYLMYKTVYWHKTVRIATAMIKKAIVTALTNGELLPTNLYGLTDDQFYQKCSSPTISTSHLIRQTKTGKLFSTFKEQPFDQDNKLHRDLLNLEFRVDYEKSLAKKMGLNSSDVIIDIPEPINFETTFPIKDGEKTTLFLNSHTVFSKPVVKGFQENLRIIRYLCP